jgi:predicted XRE-type DNA-binding protein
MTEEFELIRGSGNVFRDCGHPNADVEQLKSILAAKIIGILDDRRLSTRQAEMVTGITHSEFSRVRRAKLDRFTVDRLMAIINRLDHTIEVTVTIKPVNDHTPLNPVQEEQLSP